MVSRTRSASDWRSTLISYTYIYRSKALLVHKRSWLDAAEFITTFGAYNYLRLPEEGDVYRAVYKRNERQNFRSMVWIEAVRRGVPATLMLHEADPLKLDAYKARS